VHEKYSCFTVYVTSLTNVDWWRSSQESAVSYEYMDTSTLSTAPRSVALESDSVTDEVKRDGVKWRCLCWAAAAECQTNENRWVLSAFSLQSSKARCVIHSASWKDPAWNRACGNAAGGRVGRLPGAWTVGAPGAWAVRWPTLHSGPVRSHPVRATPCWMVCLFL